MLTEKKKKKGKMNSRGRTESSENTEKMGYYFKCLIRKCEHELIPGSNVRVPEGNKQKASK